jgi:hypothetical protein
MTRSIHNSAANATPMPPRVVVPRCGQVGSSVDRTVGAIDDEDFG